MARILVGAINLWPSIYGHQFMVRGDVRLILPNPHQQDISASLLARLLNQASITREEWESVA